MSSADAHRHDPTHPARSAAFVVATTPSRSSIRQAQQNCLGPHRRRGDPSPHPSVDDRRGRGSLRRRRRRTHRARTAPNAIDLDARSRALSDDTTGCGATSITWSKVQTALGVMHRGQRRHSHLRSSRRRAAVGARLSDHPRTRSWSYLITGPSSTAACTIPTPRAGTGYDGSERSTQRSPPERTGRLAHVDCPRQGERGSRRMLTACDPGRLASPIGVDGSPSVQTWLFMMRRQLAVGSSLPIGENSRG